MENMKYDEKADVITVKMDRCYGAVRKEGKDGSRCRRTVTVYRSTDAADALSKQTASRGTTAKHQWKTARKYCTFRKK